MELILAAVGGAIFYALMLGMTHRTYRKTLLSIADAGSCEKLPDGKFYYIVREDYFNKLLAHERNALNGKLE